jgi:hypothetical protein
MFATRVALSNFRYSAPGRNFQPVLMLTYVSLGLTVPFLLPLKKHYEGEFKDSTPLMNTTFVKI